MPRRRGKKYRAILRVLSANPVAIREARGGADAMCQVACWVKESGRNRVLWAGVHGPAPRSCELTWPQVITRCRERLIQLTGSPGPFFPTSSGQHASGMILAEAGAAGYPLTLSYDVDPQDWTDPGAAAVRVGAAQATGGRSSACTPVIRARSLRCQHPG